MSSGCATTILVSKKVEGIRLLTTRADIRGAISGGALLRLQVPKLRAAPRYVPCLVLRLVAGASSHTRAQSSVGWRCFTGKHSLLRYRRGLYLHSLISLRFSYPTRQTAPCSSEGLYARSSPALESATSNALTKHRESLVPWISTETGGSLLGSLAVDARPTRSFLSEGASSELLPEFPSCLTKHVICGAIVCRDLFSGPRDIEHPTAAFN